MRPSETLTLLADLEAAYGKSFTDEQRAVWCEYLADLDPEAARRGIVSLIATQTFFPSIAQVRAAALTPDEEGLPDALTAWGMVSSSVRASGWDADHSHLPPVVSSVAEAIGWRNIGMSNEDEPWMRKEFIALYNARRDRALHNRALGLDTGHPLYELVGGIGDGPSREIVPGRED